jgi:hypothetical protein
MSRRSALGLLGWAALAAAACSGRSQAGAGPSSANGSPTGTSSSPSGSPSPPASPTLSMTPVPAGQRIPKAVLTDAEQGYRGTWKATWKRSSGASGAAQVDVQIDPAGRTGTVSLEHSAGFFGQGSAATNGSVSGSLDVVAYEKPSWCVGSVV